MEYKKIIKPTIGKIIFLTVFYFASKILSVYVYLFAEGMPFIFHKSSLDWPGLVKGKPAEFNYIYLVMDIIIWYLMGCFIIFLFQKIKSKKVGMKLNDRSP